MREKYQIKDNDFLTFDALRQSAQCIGRVIRSKTDYGVVILADSRYNRVDKRSKFPPWIMQFVRENCLNLATDAAIDQIKSFLRLMGQPIEQESLHSILLNEDQVKALAQLSFVNSAVQSITIQNTSHVSAANDVKGGDTMIEPASPSRMMTTDEDEDDFGMAVYNDVSSFRGDNLITIGAHSISLTSNGPTKLCLSEVIFSGPSSSAVHKSSLFLLEDLLDG